MDKDIFFFHFIPSWRQCIRVWWSSSSTGSCRGSLWPPSRGSRGSSRAGSSRRAGRAAGAAPAAPPPATPTTPAGTPRPQLRRGWLLRCEGCWDWGAWHLWSLGPGHTARSRGNSRHRRNIARPRLRTLHFGFLGLKNIRTGVQRGWSSPGSVSRSVLVGTWTNWSQ